LADDELLHDRGDRRVSRVRRGDRSFVLKELEGESRAALDRALQTLS